MPDESRLTLIRHTGPYLLDKEGLLSYKIIFWQCKIITVISEWKKLFSITRCTLIFQHSHHLRLHIFFNLSIHLFTPSMKKVSDWLLFHLLTAPSTSVSNENVDLLTSPSILETTTSLTVPNLGFKEGVERLWISGLSCNPEFVVVAGSWDTHYFPIVW